jgi:hypothetical protein
MFNEQLEKLIEMALIDGVLTDKEREILKRKALSQGFDEDEFEMVLEAKFYERQQKSTVTANAQVPPTMTQSNVNTPPSTSQYNLKGIHLLLHKITETEHEQRPNFKASDFRSNKESGFLGGNSILGTLFGEDSANEQMNRAISDWEVKQHSKIISYIQNEPIPNSKDEILEFLSYAVDRSLDGAKEPDGSFFSKIGGDLGAEFGMREMFNKHKNEKEASEAINQNKLVDINGYFSQKNYTTILKHTWKQKCEQLVSKGRSICANDSSAKEQIETYAEKLGMKTEGGGFFGFFKK